MSTAIQTSKKELRDCNENEQLVRAKGRLQLDPAPHDQAKAPELDPRKTFTFWTPDQAYDHAEKVKKICKAYLTTKIELNPLFHYAHVQVNAHYYIHTKELFHLSLSLHTISMFSRDTTIFIRTSSIIA